MDRFYRHDLKALADLAGLESAIESDSKVSAEWVIIKDWSEQTRYQLHRTELEATEFVNAVEGRLLPWIKSRW